MFNPKQWFCSHKELVRVKEVNVKTGETEHFLVCFNCFKTVTKFPDVLTRASGVFERIDIRVEQEQELSQLVRRAEEYQQEEQVTEI